jgi:four helix bundle protein
MGTFKAFEDIDAWKNARILADEIFILTCEGSFAKDFRLKDQINGSAGSVMDNIAEGFERDGAREFIQFLSIAKGSSGEVRSQLYRSLDRKHIDEKKFDELMQKVIIISKQITGLISYLKKSEFKGVKFLREPTQPETWNMEPKT